MAVVAAHALGRLGRRQIDGVAAARPALVRCVETDDDVVEVRNLFQVIDDPRQGGALIAGGRLLKRSEPQPGVVQKASTARRRRVVRAASRRRAEVEKVGARSEAQPSGDRRDLTWRSGLELLGDGDAGDGPGRQVNGVQAAARGT